MGMQMICLYLHNDLCNDETHGFTEMVDLLKLEEGQDTLLSDEAKRRR